MTANKAPSYPTKGYENCASELIETQNNFLSRNEELELSPSSAHFVERAHPREAKPAYSAGRGRGDAAERIRAGRSAGACAALSAQSPSDRTPDWVARPSEPVKDKLQAKLEEAELLRTNIWPERGACVARLLSITRKVGLGRPKCGRPEGSKGIVGGRFSGLFRLVRVDYDRNRGRQSFLRQRRGMGHGGGVHARYNLYAVQHWRYLTIT
jgi:hypothetical protein